MSPSLSHFPDLCLLAMFKHIPLDKVICTVGLVCKNWARVQREELRRRRSLVIVQNYSTQLELIREHENPFGSDLIKHVHRENGSPWWQSRSLNKIKFNALQTESDGLTEKFSSSFILPNITHLTLNQNLNSENSSVSALIELTKMINHYSTRLVSLKIDFKYNFEYKENENRNHEAHLMNDLLNVINQLNSLRHLHLSIYAHHSTKIALNIQTKLMILSQLNTFSTHQFDNTKILFESLSQYATGDIRITMKQDSSLGKLLLQEPQLASKFSLIQVSDPLDLGHCDNIRLFCSRFVSLSTLKLTNHSMPMTMLARCLSQLTQLIHLKLYFGPNLQDWTQFLATQVPSVRLLTLTIMSYTHHYTEPLHISEIFPNLQVLHFTHVPLQCDICEYNGIRALNILEAGLVLEPELRTRIENCFRLTRQPFRRCTQLHTIKLDSYEHFNVLLPQGLITLDQL